MLAASGSGGSGFFLLIVIAFVFLYFVIVRPQKRRQIAAQRLVTDLNVGDEVVTAGGIIGEITRLEDDEVLVRIAPNLEVRVARRAIAGVTPPAEPEDESEADRDAEASGPTPGT
ncbi:MAG: preprotein translocase subunit YajC [Gaiellaceae bacterium]|jgi:preprotein translocase subunit YajC|nr:preprotein translocase subunit YajC [Gaiellaceae bacterium]